MPGLWGRSTASKRGLRDSGTRHRRRRRDREALQARRPQASPRSSPSGLKGMCAESRYSRSMASVLAKVTACSSFRKASALRWSRAEPIVRSTRPSWRLWTRWSSNEPRPRAGSSGWCGPSSKSGWTSPHRRVFMRRFSRSTKALPRDVMRTWIPPREYRASSSLVAPAQTAATARNWATEAALCSKSALSVHCGKRRQKSAEKLWKSCLT